MRQNEILIPKNSRVQTFSGRVKNLRNTQSQEKPIKRWMNSIIKGVPFSAGKSRYSFLLYPTNGGQTQRVVLYGDTAGSVIREDQTLSVIGREDKTGIIIGERIYEPNTDRHIQADRVHSCILTRFITALFFAAIVYTLFLLSRIDISSIANSFSGAASILRIIVIFILALLCLKSRSRLIHMFGFVLMGLGVCMIYPPIIIIVVFFCVLRQMLR